MKLKIIIQTRILLPFFGSLLLFSSCKETPETFAIHSPIYPSSGQAVNYTLRKISGDVEKVELFETISTLNASGVVTSTTSEALLQTWNAPAGDVTFNKSGGYSSNRMVNYRFVVKGNNKTYTHRISFVIRPYPVSDMPAPVYVVGDQDKVMNLVFIPDTDMNLDSFRNAVFYDIRDAFQKEDYVRRFRSSHNFYINTQTGHAHDYDTETRNHETPSNYSNLSFAQGKVILHNRVIRDFAQGGGLFSTEYYNRGTILHESGHGLYGMKDEYEGGAHYDFNTDPGNTWATKAKAEAAATRLGLPLSDANRIAPGSASDTYWELCPDDCMMEKTGLSVWPYHKPCQNRILHTILTRATN